jgi:DNA polymerase
MLARGELRLDHQYDQHADHQYVLVRDFETRSLSRLSAVGAHRYAVDPSTEVLCVAFAINDDPVRLWTPGNAIPREFFEAAVNPNWIVVAHNDAFETAIEQYLLAPRYEWPIVPISRHKCTMAAALACGLPARLSAVADALELANRKDAAGERLMHQMSKPRHARKDEDPSGIYWFEDQERLNRLYSYCIQDIEVERELYQRLPPLPPSEQVLWMLNHTINTRGFHVDRAFAVAARDCASSRPRDQRGDRHDHSWRRHRDLPGGAAAEVVV